MVLTRPHVVQRRADRWNKLPWFIGIIGCAVVAGTFSSIFSVVACAAFVLAILLLPQEETLCMFMFVMSYANIFKIAPTSQSFFTYLILIYVLWCILKKGSIKTSFFVCLVALVALLLFQMLENTDILRAIKFVANVLLIYYAMQLDISGKEKNVYMSYILGVVSASAVAALGLIPNLSDYVELKTLNGGLGNALSRFSGMYSDPNYYSVNLIIALCLIVVLNHKKLLSALPSVVLSALLVLFVSMTYSKSAFLMLLLPLLLLLYSKIKSGKYLVLVIILIIGALIAVNLFVGRIELFNTVLSRFAEGDEMDSLTTGRSVLWKNYMEYLGKNPVSLLFGTGFGAALVGEKAAHNTYIDILYYMGLSGLFLIILTFGAAIRADKGQEHEKKNILNYGVWLCLAVMYFFLSELFYFDWVFHVILAALLFKTDLAMTAKSESEKLREE